jgi:class 3 adenylate cyclase
LIGRLRELQALRTAIADARQGSPSVLVIAGPSGIGKSTLLAALADEAAAFGATVLHGGAQEGLDVPYLLLATALLPLGGVGATSTPPLDATATESAAEEGRRQVFQAVTGALFDAARLRPVVLLLDDVQWADGASIDLLSHIIASILLSPRGTRCGVLLALAHRPVEAGPLPALLDRIRRHPRSTDLTLRPLDLAESHSLVQRLAGVPPVPTTLSQLQADSGGNPLVLSGLVRRHIADGELTVDRAQLRVAPGAQLVAVRGDLEVDAQRRIDRVPEASRILLQLVAAIGPQCAHEVLERVAIEVGLRETDPREHLLVAVDAGIIREHRHGWAFELDEVRRLLEAQGNRRYGRQLHRLVADALEARGSEQPGRILHHLLLAEPLDHQRIARWAVLAADHAFAIGAWDQALADYDRALAARDAGPAGAEDDATSQAQLHLRAGLAARFASDVTSADHHLDEAGRLARDAGDITTWAEATTAKVRVNFISGSGGERAESELFEVAAVAPSPGTKARALAAAADLAYARADLDQARELALRAVAVGAEARPPEPAGSISLGIAELGTFDLRGSAIHLAEGEAAADAIGDQHSRTGARSRLLLLDLLAGDLQRVRAGGPALVSEMEAFGYWADAQVARCAVHAADVLSGDLHEADVLASSTNLILDWVPYSYTAGMLLPTQAAALAMRGDESGAEAALARWEEVGGRGAWRIRPALAAARGEVDRLRENVGRRPWSTPRRADLLSIGGLAAQVEVAAVVGDLAWLGDARRVLEDAHERGVAFVIGWPASTARLIATCHAAAGEHDHAERWLLLALETTESSGARAERARVLLELGRVRLATGSASASATLDDAAAALDGLGLLALGAEARRGLPRGRQDGARPRRRVVFCSDIVGSTQLNVRLGDEAWARVVTEHDGLLRGCFAEHDGVVFKQTGDGFFAWFSGAAAAVACAHDVHDVLERWTATHPESPLHARVGLAVGAPVDVGDDLFGLAVVSAARLCAAARTGGVLVTDELVTWCGDAATFVPAGDRDLKGLPGPVSTFDALRRHAK